jgi:IS4 transposase
MENKMQDLRNILTKFEEIVSPNFCNQLAKKCRLIQRSSSQLQGYEFAQAMMVPNAFLGTESLNSLALRMKGINKLCDLSASALAQRINTTMAVQFMKTCFAKVLKEIVKQDFTPILDLGNLCGFNRVLIEDSTRAELHEKLSPYFKGSGGTASRASVKINFVFDYLSEQIVDIDFFPGNKPDQGLANRIVSILEKDDLVIRDLGYFVLKRLKEIEEKGAYYISRWKVNEEVYEHKEAKEPLDLAKFLDKHMHEGKVDLEVYVGKEKQFVRLIAVLMEGEAINKRRRNANRSAKRHGAQISKKKQALLKYSIFITNIAVDQLSSESVMAAYRARWRIELIFKQWKSCLKLHIFKGYKKERFHCLLYGRLIIILLLGMTHAILMQHAFKLGKELSGYKLVNYFIADHVFPKMLQEGKIENFIDRLLEDMPRRLCMDKRKRPSLRNNVRMNKSYYNKPIVKELDAFAA